MRARVTIAIVCIILFLAIYFYYFSIDQENDGKETINTPVNLELNKPFRITNDSANQDHVAVFDNRVVWQDDRYGNWDIFMFDLTTGIETRITDEPSYQVEPKIYGDIIVWKDLRNNEGALKDFPVDYNSDIYLYNITTGQEKQLTSNNQSQYAPDIFGEYIVWLDYRNGKSEVILFDLKTGKEIVISDSNENCTTCKIYNNIVIWRAKIINSFHLFKYDITSGKTIELNLAPVLDVNDFNFNENYLVLSAVLSTSNDSDIFLYDFNEELVTQITTNDTCQYGPIVTENSIIWIDLRNDPDGIQWCSCKEPTDDLLFDNWDIYMCFIDNKNNSVQQLTKANDSEFLNDAHQNLIVFVQDSKNKNDIFIMKFKP